MAGRLRAARWLFLSADFKPVAEEKDHGRLTTPAGSHKLQFP
jgi:hypothetical protein